MSDGLTKNQKIAAILLGIDPELSASVLRHMGEDQVETLTRAMKELEEIAFGEGDLVSVFSEAAERFKGAGLLLGDVGVTIREVLKKAFGEEKGQELISSVEQKTLDQRPFAVFEEISDEDLVSLLIDEHPQITAIFLAHLDAGKSGKVLAKLPEEVRANLLHRIATLGHSSPEVIQRVVEVMRKKIKDLNLSMGRSEPKVWIKKAASILNNVGGSGEKAVLDMISDKDETVAESIREEMFTFDDLALLDKKPMQKVLASIDTAVLALALKACSPETEANIFNNLSKRAKEIVVDERDAKGPVPLSEVLDAQKEILGTVRSMIESGDIQPVGGGAEQMV
ncbi:MAG TPA: flagellar motor switch protein FliG [Planctomycetes bacterium]|nr:flagellar motor switch protein FliG [Planctomycetota bacterium]